MPIQPDVSTLSEALSRRARMDGGRPAVIWRDRVLTWSDLDDLAARVAGGLRSRGVKPRDIVALAVPNIPELLVAYFAVQKLGGAALLLNLALSPAELAAILADARPRALIHLDVFNDLVRSLPAEAPRVATPRLSAPPPPANEPPAAGEMLVVTIGEALEGAGPPSRRWRRRSRWRRTLRRRTIRRR